MGAPLAKEPMRTGVGPPVCPVRRSCHKLIPLQSLPTYLPTRPPPAAKRPVPVLRGTHESRRGLASARKRGQARHNGAPAYSVDGSTSRECGRSPGDDGDATTAGDGARAQISEAGVSAVSTVRLAIGTASITVCAQRTGLTRYPAVTQPASRSRRQSGPC